MKKEILFILVLTIAAFGIPGSAFAEDGAAKKFTRGALNTTTGWADLPMTMASECSEDMYQGMTYGFVNGLSNGVKRTLYGAWDWVTFPIPPHDKPVMDPETVFGQTL